MFCTNCGNEISEDTKICPYCQTSIDFPSENLSSYTNGVQADKEIYAPHPNQGKYSKPLSTSSFLIMQILMLIPIINLILILIWSFSKYSNINRRSYARSILIWFIIISITLLFILLIMLLMRYPIDINVWFNDFKAFINSIPAI